MDNTSIKAALAKAADHWSRQRQIGRMRWWGHPDILRHINRLVCGENLDGPWAGLSKRMQALAPGGTFKHGISVGCGDGAKELNLLKLGIVQHFDLFEISQQRVDQGVAQSIKLGVDHRVSFHACSIDDQEIQPIYDLVYWNNALHHMLDVEQAIHWSQQQLVQNGYFVMDDYVGSSRFQWPDDQVIIANRVRELLPQRFFIHPLDSGKVLSRYVGRPHKESLIAADPTEAADSENILPALNSVFPNADIIITGGVIYHLALMDVLANFDDQTDKALLQSLLLLDEVVAHSGHTHYAVAFARKE